jgi:hypothetical protein
VPSLCTPVPLPADLSAYLCATARHHQATFCLIQHAPSRAVPCHLAAPLAAACNALVRPPACCGLEWRCASASSDDGEEEEEAADPAARAVLCCALHHRAVASVALALRAAARRDAGPPAAVPRGRQTCIMSVLASAVVAAAEEPLSVSTQLRMLGVEVTAGVVTSLCGPETPGSGAANVQHTPPGGAHALGAVDLRSTPGSSVLALPGGEGGEFLQLLTVDTVRRGLGSAAEVMRGAGGVAVGAHDALPAGWWSDPISSAIDLPVGAAAAEPAVEDERPVAALAAAWLTHVTPGSGDDGNAGAWPGAAPALVALHGHADAALHLALAAVATGTPGSGVASDVRERADSALRTRATALRNCAVALRTGTHALPPVDAAVLHSALLRAAAACVVGTSDRSDDAQMDRGSTSSTARRVGGSIGVLAGAIGAVVRSAHAADAQDSAQHAVPGNVLASLPPPGTLRTCAAHMLQSLAGCGADSMHDAAQHAWAAALAVAAADAQEVHQPCDVSPPLGLLKSVVLATVGLQQTERMLSSAERHSPEAQRDMEASGRSAQHTAAASQATADLATLRSQLMHGLLAQLRRLADALEGGNISAEQAMEVVQPLCDWLVPEKVCRCPLIPICWLTSHASGSSVSGFSSQASET